MSRSYTRYWKKSHCGRYKSHCCGRNWYKFDLVGDTLPKLPCCYVLYLDDELVYIGSTVNLYKRFFDPAHRIIAKPYVYEGQLYYQFITKWGTFDNAYLKIRFSDFIGDWAQKEIYLIDRIKPMYNKMYNW
jgi:hypothetical protein